MSALFSYYHPEHSEGSLVPNMRDSSIAKNAPSERHCLLINLHRLRRISLRRRWLFSRSQMEAGSSP